MTSLSIGLYPRRVFCIQPSFVHSWSCPRVWDQWACWSESSPPDICHRVWQSSSDSSPPLHLHHNSIRHSNPRNHNPHLSKYTKLLLLRKRFILIGKWLNLYLSIFFEKLKYFVLPSGFLSEPSWSLSRWHRGLKATFGPSLLEENVSFMKATTTNSISYWVFKVHLSTLSSIFDFYTKT